MHADSIPLWTCRQAGAGLKRFLLTFSFLAASAAAMAADQDLVRWMGEDEALALSKKSGKPLLYHFMAAWSVPSRRMAAEVFGNSNTAEWINQNFLPVRFRDEERERGANSIRFGFLKRKYGIDAYPALVVEVTDKRIFHKWKKSPDYRGPEATRKFLENTLSELKEGK